MANYMNPIEVVNTGRRIINNGKPEVSILNREVHTNEILVGVYIMGTWDENFLVFPFASAVIISDDRELQEWENRYKQGMRVDRRFYAIPKPA